VGSVVADLNAISPASARRAAQVAAEHGCLFVDGSISGPPPWNPGTTRLYLAGARAGEVAGLPFTGVDRIVVSDEVGSASAVKDEHGVRVQGKLGARPPGGPRSSR